MQDTHISFENEQHEELREYAHQNRLSMSEVVRRAVAAYLKDMGQEIGSGKSCKL